MKPYLWQTWRMTLWPKYNPVKDQQSNYEFFHKYFYETCNFGNGQLQYYPHSLSSFWKSAAFPIVPRAGTLLEWCSAGMCYVRFHEQYFEFEQLPWKITSWLMIITVNRWVLFDWVDGGPTYPTACECVLSHLAFQTLLAVRQRVGRSFRKLWRRKWWIEDY